MELRRLGRTALRVSELCLGTMNFGPLTTQEDSFVIMDRALDLGINFFDTANRYGGPKGPGHHRDDHRQLVRAGRRPAREGRARDQGVRPDVRVAERRRALGSSHPRRVRSEPAPVADRSHRPLPDAPRRPERAVGRDLAGDGDARRPGQGDLRRQQQLRGLAHRAGQRGRSRAQLPRARQRAEPLQPRVAHGGARGAARVPRLRPRASSRGARSPAGCSAATPERATPPGARA